MDESRASEVRPTIRCLKDDLQISLPAVDAPLHQIAHPLMMRAQLIPEQAAAGSTERIKSLSDRWWLRVKIRGSGWRGAVTAGDNVPQDLKDPCGDYWWLGAAGKRDEDSKHDFYNTVASQATSDWMLPTRPDAVRISVERAFADEIAIRARIRELLVKSLMSGKVWTAEYRGHTLSVLVRAPDGETFVSVGTTGIASPAVFAVLLDSVPGTTRDDWLPEPSRVAGFEPRSGEIIFSTVIDPKALADLCDQYPVGTLDVTDGG